MDTKTVSINELKLNKDNPRVIKDDKFKKLVKSIKDFPEMLDIRPVVVDEDMIILGGNMRYRACVEAGLTEIPIHIASGLTQEQKEEFIVKDNVGFGDWEWDILANEWDNVKLGEWGLDVWVPELEVEKPDGVVLTDKFLVPPFTILDTRQGYWQDRKKLWKSKINDLGETRETSMNDLSELKYGTWKGKLKAAPEVSILDPVLAEIACKWFCVEKGRTFDCFAGDTVFGYVSGDLGHDFTGIELRKEQAAINNERVRDMSARYICDDGQNVSKHIKKNSMDMLFSCPPYYDLEVYSDMDNDASNQESYDDFISILDKAFTDSIECLKDDRFAVIVCGDVRDKKGNYYRFPDHIKDIFERAGMSLYNEMILVEMIGTLAMRAARTMKNRKVSKCHQNVLVFYKGDISNIQKNYKDLTTELTDILDES